MLVWGPGEVWYVFVAGRGGRCYGEWVTGLGWALPILEEHGESWICVCVLVAVVWVVLGIVGGRLGPGSGMVGCC